MVLQGHVDPCQYNHITKANVNNRSQGNNCLMAWQMYAGQATDVV